jgi:3-phenylpropionate/trans-cinnamate dioxygenase ferredoxin reductase component
VTLVGAEPEPPYERPPLSKAYLLGRLPRGELPLRPAAQYRELEASLLLGERAVELDLDQRLVRLASGRTLAYDLLLVATGARARRLAGADGALRLRDVADADRLRAELASASRLEVVGAGFVGCEVAAAARQLGLEVTVYEMLPQPLLRVLGAEVGGWLASLHRSQGVDLRTGLEALPELGWPVLAAVGSEPRTELAAAAGLEVAAGVVVDELGRTSAPGVYAAGDVARFWSPPLEARVRVEHFQTAWRHGVAVGRAMAGRHEPFEEVPWFWSDQYELNLQYVGGGLPWDQEVVRGVLGRPPFTVFQLAGGRLRAAVGVGDHRTVAAARRLLGARAEVTAAQLEDQALDLRRLGRPGSGA